MLGGIPVETGSVRQSVWPIFLLVIAGILLSTSIAWFGYLKSSELVVRDDEDIWFAIGNMEKAHAEYARDLENLKKANVQQVKRITEIGGKQRQRGPIIEAASDKAGQALDRVVHLEGRVTKLEQTIPAQQKSWYGGPRR